MTRDEVISIILQNDELFTRIAKSIDINEHEDIKQQMYVKVLALSDSKLIEINMNGYLIHYICRVLYNTAKKMHRAKRIITMEILPDSIVSEENVFAKLELSRVKNILEKMYWYDREMFRAYIEEGSLRNVVKKTGIPIRSVQDTVNRVKKKFK